MKQLFVVLLSAFVACGLTACGSNVASGENATVESKTMEDTVNVDISAKDEPVALDEFDSEMTEAYAESENEEDSFEPQTYTVTEEDLCRIMEGFAGDILNAKVAYSIATTNIENVNRQINGFANYFVSNYDEQELRGCVQLGRTMRDLGTGYDKYLVDATIEECNFDRDGFTYYDGSNAELNVTFNLNFHLWAEHDSRIDSKFDRKISAIFVLEYNTWKIRYLNQESRIGFNFKHIRDENMKGVDESQTDSAPEWKNIYIDYFGDSSNCYFESFNLADINHDDIPEVCVEYESQMDRSLYYITKDNEVKKIEGNGIAEYGDRCIIIKTFRFITAYSYDNETGDYTEYFDVTNDEYNSLTEGCQWMEVDTLKYDADSIIDVISEY